MYLTLMPRQRRTQNCSERFGSTRTREPPLPWTGWRKPKTGRLYTVQAMTKAMTNDIPGCHQKCHRLDRTRKERRVGLKRAYLRLRSDDKQQHPYTLANVSFCCGATPPPSLEGGVERSGTSGVEQKGNQKVSSLQISGRREASICRPAAPPKNQVSTTDLSARSNVIS